MQALHLKFDGGGQILVRNARHGQLADDHVAARQHHRSRHVAEAQLAHEQGVLAAPHAGRLMAGIGDGERAQFLRPSGTHARGGDPQRLDARRAGDFNAQAAAKGQPRPQFTRNQCSGKAHGARAPMTPAPAKPGCPGTFPPVTGMPS